MQRLGQIIDYAPLSEKEIATFLHPVSSSENARLVKLRVIAENETALYYALGEKPKADAFQLLTVVPAGLEDVEFYVLGTFHLAARGGEVMLSTSDNLVFNLGPDEAESYARIWEREERDPVLLQMDQLARQNERRLREQLLADFAAHEARMREITNGGNVNLGQAPASASAPVNDGTGSTSVPASPDGNHAAASVPEGGQS